MNDSGRGRIIGVLAGDIQREPGNQVKYGHFFHALDERFSVVDVYDASLKGPERMVNLLQTFHPQVAVWRERFYKNVQAFDARSRKISRRIVQVQSEADLILQLGAMFHSQGLGVRLPVVIYTDYTARLSAERRELGRSPFTPAQLQQWLDRERAVYSGAAHIFTRSQQVCRSLLEDYGLPPERVSVAGGGVNYAALPDLVDDAPAKTPTALFIGKELYRKGGDLALRAFARARQIVPEARLLLLTEGPLPKDLPLGGVEWIRPTWDREVISGLYRQAQVFVLPARLETWGDVLLEAMSHGLACIGVYGQAMEEIIEHERTGLIVEPEDEEALAAALVRLFTNPGLCTHLGRKARMRVEKDFTWERVVGRMEPVLSRIVLERRGEAG